MTVEDLIALLQTLPPTAIVFLCTGLVVDARYDGGRVHVTGERDHELPVRPW